MNRKEIRTLKRSAEAAHSEFFQQRRVDSAVVTGTNCQWES